MIARAGSRASPLARGLCAALALVALATGARSALSSAGAAAPPPNPAALFDTGPLGFT